MTMVAGLPFTTLRDVVLTHPTMVEGFNKLIRRTLKLIPKLKPINDVPS
jgi:hypothetical protein